MATPRVLIPMADHGHDPTETSVPYSAFKEAGFAVDFATENGRIPACDSRLLTGLSQKLLGATQAVIASYKTMAESPEFKQPLSWSSPSFGLDDYNLVFLPGGHDKGVRQLIDSAIMSKVLATFFARTRKPSKQAVSAVCHGVMVLSEATIPEGPEKGKSPIHACETTALPARFEQLAFWGTRLFLGDYYKTYGAGSADVEDAVTAKLDDPSLWKGSLGMAPFVVQDQKYNYLSARFPGDAALLAEKTVELVKENMQSV